MKKSEKRELMLRLVNEFFENHDESAQKMYDIFDVLDDSAFSPALKKVLADCRKSWKSQLLPYFNGETTPSVLYTAQKSLMEAVAFLDLSIEEE